MKIRTKEEILENRFHNRKLKVGDMFKMTFTTHKVIESETETTPAKCIIISSNWNGFKVGDIDEYFGKDIGLNLWLN